MRELRNALRNALRRAPARGLGLCGRVFGEGDSQTIQGTEMTLCKASDHGLVIHGETYQG